MLVHPLLSSDGTPRDSSERSVPKQDSTALTPRHAEVLRRSAVHPAVAAEAGCVSVTPDDPRLEAFDDYQRAPVMLFPVHPPDGSNDIYSLRRDRDRVRGDGSRAKCKQLATMVDVPERAP